MNPAEGQQLPTGYRAYKTVYKMLNKRYPGQQTSQLTLKQFTDQKPPIIKYDTLWVYFPDEEKIGVKTIRIFKNEMVAANIYHAILVIKNSISPFAKTEIQCLINEDPPINIEIFIEKELIVDITEHPLVPKHELLTEEEKQKLLKDMSIKESQLQRILLTDPVARYLGLKKHDVVKITRPSETSGTYVVYRIAV